jgi:hypothetical protein
MAKIARTHVHVHKKDGTVKVFAAGEEIPAWAQKVITNNDVYAENAESVEPDSDGGDEGGEQGPYDGKSDDELRAILRERELPTDGDTAALVERLTQADAEQE